MVIDKNNLALALLRGINVGGKNILPMKPLAEIFSVAGSTNVRTYIQSGNVIFHSKDAAKVAEIVRQQIEAQFGWKIPVIVRTLIELERVVADNPFLRRRTDPGCLHVMFLDAQPTPKQVAALDKARSPGDEFDVIHRAIYLHLPNGAARTKLTNAYFDTTLKTISTQRNWRTVLTLANMMTSVEGPTRERR